MRTEKNEVLRKRTTYGILLFKKKSPKKLKISKKCFSSHDYMRPNSVIWNQFALEPSFTHRSSKKHSSPKSVVPN